MGRSIRVAPRWRDPPVDRGRPVAGVRVPARRGGLTDAALPGCMFVVDDGGERTHAPGHMPTAYAHHPRADRWARLPDPPEDARGLGGNAAIGGQLIPPNGRITLGGGSGSDAVRVYQHSLRCE